MFHCFHKKLLTNFFHVLLVEDFATWKKKTRNIYTRMLEFSFSGEDMTE